jgi:REP element-mobilizing transposase RayT
MSPGVTAPRQILPGRTYLVTRRCTQRLYLLRPDEQTNAIFAYCLGEAAARTGIELIAWCAMSNHYHAVVHDPHGKLPAFLEHLHKMIARALNARWEREENLWSTNQTSVVALLSPEAVFEKVCYVLTNPTNDHLVDRLVDWPGHSSLHHLDGRRTTHKRPVRFFRADGPMPESVELFAVQPPSSRAVESAEQWARRVRNAVDDAERTRREERLRDGGRVRGRKAILRDSPLSSPATPAQRSALRPSIATRDKQQRIEAIDALRDFQRRYRDARMSYVAGDRDVEFPCGTYRLRELGVSCAPYDSLSAQAA